MYACGDLRYHDEWRWCFAAKSSNFFILKRFPITLSSSSPHPQMKNRRRRAQSIKSPWVEFKWAPFINYQKDDIAASSNEQPSNSSSHVKRQREYGLRVIKMFARGEVSGSKSNKLFHHRQLNDPEINETWLLYRSGWQRTRTAVWLQFTGKFGSTVNGEANGKNRRRKVFVIAVRGGKKLAKNRSLN